MSDLDDVVRLLERWRDATGIGRLRIGMDASRVIAALPPARKRDLAVEVAARVAPQLVPAIRADDGDLTAEQVGALVDLLRRADEDQLDDLVTALRTGELGAALAIVDDAVAVVAPPPAPEPPDPGPPADEPTDEAAEDAAPSGDTPVADAPHDEEPAGHPVDEPVPPAAEPIEPAAPAGLADDEIEIGADGSVEVDEAAVRARLEREAAARADRYRDTSRDVPTTPSYRAPAMDFTTDLDLPDPTPLRRSGDGPSAGRDAARLAAPPVTGVVAAITATPDGYRRRRAALTAIREGRLEGDDLPTVARSFTRGTDRAWVAGAALDAGVIGADGLTGIGLSPAAEARLRRRAS